jgi:hypothetical protein
MGDVLGSKLVCLLHTSIFVGHAVCKAELEDIDLAIPNPFYFLDFSNNDFQTFLLKCELFVRI